MTIYIKRGISGFRHFRDAPLPECDLGEFRSYCYTIAREVGCHTVPQFQQQGRIDCNFIMAVFGLPKCDVAALLDLHFPVIGFSVAPAENESCELEFVDCEELANAFRKYGRYEVLSKSELEMPLTPVELERLSAADISQVKSWKPECIGHLIFNYWD